MHSEDYLQRTVVGPDGTKIGVVSTVVDAVGQDTPQWATVTTGLLGTHESYVPLAGSTISDGKIVVGYTKEQVRDAPKVSADQRLSDPDAGRLSAYYGLGTAMPATQPSAVTDLSADQRADVVVTRSEELLHVGVERMVTGVVKVSKYIVTETVTHTVEVSHEEIRIERQTGTGSAATMPAVTVSAPATSRDLQLILHAEQVVITKQVVPVERVTLAVVAETEQRDVQDSVRRERIEVVDNDGVDISGAVPGQPVTGALG